MSDSDSSITPNEEDDELEYEADSPSSDKSRSRSRLYPRLDEEDDDSGLSFPSQSPQSSSDRNGIARRTRTAKNNKNTSQNESHEWSRSRIYPQLHPGEEPKRRSLGATGGTTLKPRQQPSRKPSSTSNYGWLLTIVIIIVIMCALCAVFIPETKQEQQPVMFNSPPQRIDLSRDHLVKEFKRLKAMFTNQLKHHPKSPWQVVLNSITMMNEPGQKQPAIVLWAPLVGAAKTVDCMVDHTFRALYNVSRDVVDKWMISSDAFLSGDSSRDKKALDDRLEEILGNEIVNIPVALIRHIDRLDPNMALLFHKYCDHESSRRPKSIIMLTFNEEIPAASQTHIYDLLRSKWISPKDKVDQGQVDAILARILAWPLYVEKEEQAVLEKYCS